MWSVRLPNEIIEQLRDVKEAERVSEGSVVRAAIKRWLGIYRAEGLRGIYP